MANTELMFKAMADSTRQRLLRVLSVRELSVNEIVEVLDQPQSTISRHLKVLKDAGLLVDRRSGTTVMYAAHVSRQVPAIDLSEGRTRAGKGKNGMAGGTVIRDWLLGWIGSERLEDSTRDRLGRILGRRPAANTGFFDAVGDRWDQLRIDAFGRAFHFEAFTALLPGDWVVADVGCGTGYLLGWLSERFSKVIAVDPAASMLEVARNRPELKQAQNVDFREGSLADLPVDDSEVDLVIASLVLHHMADPTVAMPELRRCLKAGGTLMIIEQEVHDNELFRDRMGDERWGLDPQMLGQWASRTGFSEIHIIPLSTVEPTKRDIGRTPGLFVLTATSGKPKVVKTARVRKVRVKPGTRKARPHRPAKPEPDVITGVETQMDVHLL